ncbi:MAG: hypothetical protein Q7J73_07575 [Dehalococcoidales bacterium]|nr:hypothetical protein [Dehalococcoidales bacterium]
MGSRGGGFWQVEELSESVTTFKDMWRLLPVGELKSIDCLSTALDRLNMGQSEARQQLGIAAFSGEGVESQCDAILAMAAFAMTGAAVIARTAMIIAPRSDFNKLVLIYIIIIQA